MTMILALTWQPTPKDMERFRRLYPQLMGFYAGLSIFTPPGCDPAVIAEIAAMDGVKLTEGSERIENRRYKTLAQALTFESADYIHACDGDHALARFDRFPDDWRRSMEALRAVDCLIIGRSRAVFDSYPRPLRDTEEIINKVGSHLLGQPVDLGSGARGFSRRAADYLIAYASPQTHGVATDSEWPVLLHRVGYTIGTFESEGAVYEVNDEAHRARIESAEGWAKRVELARLIIQAALDVSVTQAQGNDSDEVKNALDSLRTERQDSFERTLRQIDGNFDDD